MRFNGSFFTPGGSMGGDPDDKGLDLLLKICAAILVVGFIAAIVIPILRL